jgi:hypothetical protein
MKLSRTTWLLVAALAAVAAYFFLVDQKGRHEKEQRALANRRLFPYTRADVERFILLNPKGERIEAVNQNGTWSIVYPVEAPGDQPAIESFLDQVVPGRRGIELPDARNLADYGLEKPFATLILYHRGASVPDTLTIGDKTPTSSNSYVRLGSSTSVFISSEITHNVMNKGLLHLRDKNFLPPGTAAVTGFTIRDGRRSIELRKEGASWWLLSPPVRANSATIEAYLSRLTDAVIHQFVREDTKDLAPYGLERPARELTLTKRQETLTIAFGTAEKDLVPVVRTGLDKVVLIEGSFLQAFDWTAASLRAKNIAFFADDSVKTVRYEGRDTTVVFTRQGSRWRTAAADTSAIKWWEVNGLLRTLRDTNFDSILAEPLPPDDPRLRAFLVRVTLGDARGATIDRIVIAPAGASGQVGASTSANALGTLPAGTAEKLEEIFERTGSKQAPR